MPMCLSPCLETLASPLKFTWQASEYKRGRVMTVNLVTNPGLNLLILFKQTCLNVYNFQCLMSSFLIFQHRKKVFSNQYT